MNKEVFHVSSENFTFWYLFKSLMGFRQGIIQLFFLHILWILFELVLPFLTQSLVDNGINNQDYNFIFLVLLAQLFLFIGSISAEYFKAWVLRHIGIRLNMRLINNLLFNLMVKDILYFRLTKEGKIIELFNDSGRIERFLTESASTIIDTVLRLLLYGTVLYIFNPFICLIFCVSVVVSILWDLFFLKERREFDELRYNASSKGRSELIETIQAMPDIKVNNMEWSRIRSWEWVQDLLSKTRLRVLQLSHLYQGGTKSINQVRDILVIYYSAIFVVEGTLTLGAMLAIQFILGQLNKQTLALMTFIQSYHDAQMSLERIKAATEGKQSNYVPIENFDHRDIKVPIKIKDLSYDYTTIPCLESMNLEIPYGKKIALVGESGCGKSTLIKTLLKLLIPDSGSILIGNQDLQRLEDNVWRQNCSVLMQESYIFSDSILFNICLEKEVSSIDEEHLGNVLKWSSLDQIVAEQEKGLDTLIGKGAKSLSKGQTQRVLLARALYKKGNYIILDEPTSALDMHTSKKVIKSIFTEFKDKTIIYSTHKAEMTKQADYIYVIHDGKIVEHGIYEDLLNLKGQFYRLFEN